MSKLLKLAIGLMSGVVLFAAENPWVGTWKLETAKSKLSASPKAAKELTITVRDVGDQNVEVNIKGATNDGTPISAKYIVPMAGGPNTYIEGAPPAGITEETKKIDERTRNITASHDGKTLRMNHVVLSDDGNTITGTIKGVDNEDKPLALVEVFERQ